MLIIEIDCQPGSLRPDYFYNNIIDSLQHNQNQNIKNEFEKLKNNKPVSKLFGNWTWKLDINNTKTESEIQAIFKEKLTQYYNNGAIRYAGW